MNIGDIVVVFMIGAGFAGLAGYIVYDILGKGNDRAHEQRNGTTDYWTDAPPAGGGTPNPEAADRSEP